MFGNMVPRVGSRQPSKLRGVLCIRQASLPASEITYFVQSGIVRRSESGRRGLFGKSFNQPNVASGHNVTKREIAPIRRRFRVFDFLGPFVENVVLAVQSYMIEGASSKGKSGDE
jgi:hypothetical protein